jgi:hypothetical protein
VQLEGVTYAPPNQLYDTFEFARKGLHRSNPPAPVRASPGCDDEGVVTVSAHSPLFVCTGRQGRSHSIPSIYDNALVLPQPRLPIHRARSTRS